MTNGSGAVDLAPTAAHVTALLNRIEDRSLGAPTPCPGYDVADLLDHFLGLTLAFTHTARKAQPGPGPDAGRGRQDVSGTRLDPRWRELLPERLDDLAAAWAEPDAWAGTSSAGGVELPAAVLGLVAANELVVHGWDVARAVGAPYDTDPAVVAAIAANLPFADFPEEVYGRPVEVPPAAPALDHLIGLNGRDPGWTP